MKHTIVVAIVATLPTLVPSTGHWRPWGPHASLDAAPVIHWSNEARRAIVPPGPAGVFGAENYGNKFPGEAAIYMGIVHGAMHDAAVAIARRPKSHELTFTVRTTPSPEAAIATAVHHALIGLQPALGLTQDQQAGLDARYADYLAQIPESPAKASGLAIGERAASAMLATRLNDGREDQPQLIDLNPPPAGPGVWDPGSSPAVGLRMPGIRPLALESGSQFRPAGPHSLTSDAYADDLLEVETFGRADSTARTAEQTSVALFWNDHDLRQWNDGLLRLAAARALDLERTARMLAMAHVAGGDAMIACFDAKYTYWLWRPYQAIARADTDGNPATSADATWQPLRPTPNHPEYPSAHACHTSAIVETLSAFFGTDRIPFSLDSRVTGTTRQYSRLRQVVLEVERARVLAGFHYRASDREGSTLGRRVARYVTTHAFKPRLQ
jgi:hypothetical protein